MPEELSSHHLRARLLQLAGLVAIVALVIWLTPGLGEPPAPAVRDLLRGRQTDAASMCEPLAEPIQVELEPREAISGPLSA